MSTTLAARYPQDRPQAIVIGAKREGQTEHSRGEAASSHPLEFLSTAQNKAARRMVDPNFSKSVNNQPHADSTTNTDQFFQSSFKVSYQNEQHAY